MCRTALECYNVAKKGERSMEKGHMNPTGDGLHAYRDVRMFQPRLLVVSLHVASAPTCSRLGVRNTLSPVEIDTEYNRTCCRSTYLKCAVPINALFLCQASARGREDHPVRSVWCLLFPIYSCCRSSRAFLRKL